MHKANSIYEDEPDAVYDFPRPYLKAVEAAVGDWIVYYEPVKAGPRGYFAVARIDQVIPKPGHEGRFLAIVAPGTYLEFDRNVPRLADGRPFEEALRHHDGTPKKGGAAQLAVRRMTDDDFTGIVDLGLPQSLEAIEAARYEPQVPGSDVHVPPHVPAASRPVLERLTRRAYRDVAFRRAVREAYGYRCAMSGLELRNGGGQPEVQAAHIRPVAHGGSDAVRNGLALSGTLHWMFDRGLVSVADDGASILVSRNKVPRDVADTMEGGLRRPRWSSCLR